MKGTDVMKRTFSLILAVIMITAVFAAALPVFAESTAFSDVGADRWSAASISYAVEKGYMKGVGGGKFNPAGSLTRAMVATVLWRRQGEPLPDAPSGFSDVPANEWYADAVAWAKETGVVKGISDINFDPNGKITREQLATMLFRFSSSLVPDAGGRADLTAFSDAGKVSGWAKEPLEWAVEAGLIKGTDGNRLSPGGFATREQFSAIIERFDIYAANAEKPLVAADFYVSPTGNDEWNGSFARPFRTIGRAMLAVRKVPKTADRGGITVAVRAGEYCLFDSDMSASDSGTEDCPVSYIEYGDGEVVLTDRFEVSSECFTGLSQAEETLFGKSASHIKKADISNVFPTGASTVSYTVTGNVGELWSARFPNKFDDGEEVFFPSAADVSGTATLFMRNSILGGHLAKYSSLDGVMICGDLCYSAFFEHVEIGAYDAESRTATVADPSELRSYPWFGGFRYVTNESGAVDTEKTQTGVDVYIEGAAEELDRPGEFHVDPAHGILYVYDPSGDYVFEAAEHDPDTRAEHVTLFGNPVGEKHVKTEFEMPVVYVDKEGDSGFRILNLSDPQLSDSEWNGDAGRILTETVNELVRTESPDLITVTGDLAWGSSLVSCEKLADLLAGTGIPWACVLGNHDHEIDDAGMVEKIGLLTSRSGCLFEWGDPDIGCGNYLIVLRQNGIPVHALIMMDSNSDLKYIDENGEVHSVYAEFTEDQIKWYGLACEKLEELGVHESSLLCHIPCYTYREAFAAALLPGINPKEVPSGDGMQVGCWAPGYEDSFGVVHEDGIASCDRDNGFFDKVLEYNNTKTLLCGHDHINCFSIPYRGVRFVYSLKAGSGCYWESDMNGGTMIDIASDGTATVRHHYVTP